MSIADRLADFAKLQKYDKGSRAYDEVLKVCRDNYAIACTEWAEGRAEGLAEGRAEGIAEGIEIGRNQILTEQIQKARELGLSENVIAMLFGNA